MAVNCVVPNKKQAESLGITEGQLKNILQEYTNSQELQSQFTEEEFIDSKLNGLPVIGVSDAQMQAWDEVYSTPREFDSIEDYNEAASTAEAIFGREAIGHRETPEGKHILSVAKPQKNINKINSTIDKNIENTFEKSISFIPYKRTGEVIDSTEKGRNICNVTQVLCVEMIADAFNNGDLAHNVKSWPVSIDAKSPLEDSIIDHSTVIVKVNGEYYLFDMPQSEFITPTGKTFTQEGKEFNEGIIGEFKPRLIPINEDSIGNSYNINGEPLKRTMDTLLSKIEDLEKRSDFEIVLNQNVQETINIWAGTNENTDLSNMAERPFVYNGIQFNSVEQAFQYIKGDYAEYNGYKSADGTRLAASNQAIILRSTPWDAKRLGRRYTMDEVSRKNWDAHSSEVMKDLIKESFIQNPQALQRLLDTGDAVFTHTQEREGSKWREEFPKLLMEVRDELRNEQNVGSAQETASIITNIRPENRAVYQRGIARQRGISSLYDNSVGLTTTEVQYEARQLSYWISDNVTDIQNNPELLYNKFGVAKTNDWATEGDKQKDIKAVSNMSRRQIISKVTLNKFRDVYKNDIFVDNPAIDDLTGRDAEKLPILIDNIDTLFDLGLSTFKQSEGFSITYDSQLNVEQIVDSDGTETFIDDDVVDLAQLAEEGVKLEDWMIDKEAMDILGTATAQVKAALSQAFEVDSEGRDKLDYLGRKVRLSQDDAVKSIIRWTQGSQDINDMIAKLDEKANTHPWLIQIVERLEDTTGETDFISQFYSTFQKHFVLFDIVKKNNRGNRYYFMDVNNRPALNQAMNEIMVNFQLNLSPMFTSTGYNQHNLEIFKSIVAGLKAPAAYNATEEQFNAKKDNFAKVISSAARLLGYEISPEKVSQSINYSNIKSVTDSLDKILTTFESHPNTDGTYNPFKYSRGKDTGSIRGYLKDFLSTITESVEDTTESSFYEAGKMRQSYQVPAYITKLFGKLQGDSELFNSTLQNEFMPFEWFYQDGEWRNSLLGDLADKSPEERRELLVYKRNLKFGKDQYMRGMSQERYGLSVLTEFASPRFVNGMPVSFYRLPIQSNKASSDFVSFYRYTGRFYKDNILSNLLLTFGQELSRIQTVEMRSRKKGDTDYIENFDGKRGRQFCFLDFLNDPKALVNDSFTSEAADKFKSLIDAKVKGEEVDDVALNELAKRAIESGLNNVFANTYEHFRSLGMLDAIKNIEGVLDEDSKIPADIQVQRFIENFVWNDTLASINVTQLLVTDLAFYKNSDDFQKRFAQVHSPGVRGNEFAVDYDGIRVSDGKIRMVFLNDFENFKTNIIDNLRVVLDRNIAQAPKDAQSKYTALKSDILSSMEKINVTDGQALISPTFARKVGYMYGKWSQELEQAYGRVTKGNYSLNDRTALTNVRKPFIYSQLLQSVNTDGTPLSNLRVGTQIKDSEYMLVLAGALLRNAETGRPNFLKILYDVMEDSAYNNGVNYNGKGIDIFAFNSAVKTGLTGSSDVSTRWANGDYSKESTQKAEAELKNYLLSQIYLTDESGAITNSYNQFAVKEIPVEDYATQVENPFHTLDERVIWGSQMRAILESNLNYVDSVGNPVTFTWTDNNGQEHNVGRDDFKRAYEENAAAIIDTFIDETKDEFGLGDKNTSFEDSRIAIANALQEEILKNIDRYGPDMLLACSIDETGKFKLPPGDPTQGKRIAQLVNSIIKNRLNKPKVAGGMAVQVSSFGMSDQLHIRFFAKDGKTLLPTKEEWLKDRPNGDYKKFCEENQGGIAYEENYAPAHMGEFFRYFTDSNGNVDVEAIEMLDENLLLSIDERTPTEFYYSISVAKIKDFLPKEAGDGFMRPYEITEIDDSDFDNDKQSKWKLSAQIVRNKEKFGVKELIDAVPELQAMDKGDAKNIAKKFLDRETDKFQKSYTVSENPNLFRAMKEAYIKANFSVQYPTEGENALLNNSWRMSLAVLQSESNAAKLLSPGGNADLARQGYLAEAVSVTGRSYDELDALDTDSIKDIVSNADKNVMLFINQMEYYKRNNDASSNLGIFAVAATSHNLLEGQGYAMANSEEFTIAGKHFDEIVELDPMYDTDGMLVSKSLGSNVSGAADAAKVPSHGYLNINGNTINEYLVLLRTGMPQYKAAQLFATKPLKSLVSELTSANVERVTTNIKTLLNNRLNTIITEMNLPKDSSLYREELSWDEIKQSLSNPTPEMEFKILLAFQRLGNLTEGMRAFTFVTRYNSIASAVGPLITDNIWHEHQLDTYNEYKGLKKIGFKFLDASDNNAEKTFGDTVTNRLGNAVVVTPYNHADLELQGIITPSFSFNDVTLEDVKNEHPMLRSFSMGYDLAREMFDRLEMPLISSTFRGVINLPEYQGFFFSNKDGLNKFSDFYLSYLLVQSGIIKSDASLKNDGPQYYIRKFPREFLSKRNSYRGNTLVDMIHPRIDEDVISLELKTSGMKVDTKTELQSAWLELYKKDAGFALDLFKYNFWKGGLGFSPKTFMNLIPIQIKEQIKGYTQTFTKNGPSVSGEIVLDQFFRNNAKDNNIVRFISDFSRGDNRYDQKTKKLVFGESWYDDLKKSPFIKFKDGSGKIRLFKIDTMDSETQTLTYIETTGLGNNGEFIEISNKPISKSFVDSEIADAEDTNDSPIEPSEIPADRTPSQIRAEAEEYAGYFKDSSGNVLKNRAGNDLTADSLISFAVNAKENMKGTNPDWVKDQKDKTKALFEANGIKYSDDKINEIVRKLC